MCGWPSQKLVCALSIVTIVSAVSRSGVLAETERLVKLDGELLSKVLGDAKSQESVHCVDFGIAIYKSLGESQDSPIGYDMDGISKVYDLLVELRENERVNMSGLKRDETRDLNHLLADCAFSLEKLIQENKRHEQEEAEAEEAKRKAESSETTSAADGSTELKEGETGGMPVEGPLQEGHIRKIKTKTTWPNGVHSSVKFEGPNGSVERSFHSIEESGSRSSRMEKLQFEESTMSDWKDFSRGLSFGPSDYAIHRQNRPKKLKPKKRAPRFFDDDLSSSSGWPLAGGVNLSPTHRLINKRQSMPLTRLGSPDSFRMSMPNLGLGMGLANGNLHDMAAVGVPLQGFRNVATRGHVNLQPAVNRQRSY